MKQRFMRLAEKMALHGEHPLHKVGAVIVKGNRIVSLGFNKQKTSPRSTHPHFSIHAEMDAIFKAREDLSKATIYVSRMAKSGPRLSKPCNACQQMLNAVGIRNVFHS